MCYLIEQHIMKQVLKQKRNSTVSQELLQQQIEEKRKEIVPERQDMTIGELANLYKEDELIINPDFQRFFRWTIDQKSKLIESILLGIPLPPVFIFERKDGKWEVIDGLQRLSSLFEFIGIIKPKKSDILRLEETPYLKELKGMSWTDLSEPQQRYIKRATISIVKLKFDSQEFTKYELFQRLNRGGSPLTEQEIRNCIIVMEDKKFFSWMENLSKNQDFIETCILSDKKIEEREDLNLITRYLCFKYTSLGELKTVNRVDEFLNSKIVQLARNINSIDLDNETKQFSKIFEALNQQLGGDAFKKYYSDDKFKGGFALSIYESIIFALVQPNAPLTDLHDKAIKLQTNPVFKKHSGSGRSVNDRWNNLLGLSLEIF